MPDNSDWQSRTARWQGASESGTTKDDAKTQLAKACAVIFLNAQTGVIRASEPSLVPTAEQPELSADGAAVQALTVQKLRYIMVLLSSEQRRGW